MKKYIGIDLGGTNIRAAIVQEDGKILCMKKSESHPERGAEPVMETMISLIESLDGSRDLSIRRRARSLSPQICQN